MTSDFKWQTHIGNVTKRAYSRVLILRRLSEMGAGVETLVDTYYKQVRTVLEYCVPVWHSRLTLCQSDQIERVQNVSMMIILGEKYKTSNNAREKLKIETLQKRRNDICLKFGQKALKHPNHSNWFQPNPNHNKKRRLPTNRLKETFCRTDRYKNSTIPFLTRILNKSMT